MKIITLIFSCCLIWLNNSAQVLPQSNDYPELGLKFEIQDGWSAEQSGEIVMMGHRTMPGLIIMSFNEAESAASLRTDALEGIVDDGVNLKAIGDFKITNSNKVSGIYEGIWDGAEVKCFAIGLINKLGPGVNVLVVTTKEMYSDQHVLEVEKIAKSVVFYQPKIADQSVQWRNKLVPALVKYISSSYSTDYSGGSSGTSSTESITLCSNGYFSYYSNNHASITAGDGAGGESGGGYSNSNGSSQGNFEIKTIGGQSYLILNFEGGKVYEYSLQRNDEGHTLLDGTRYFVVETEDCN